MLGLNAGIDAVVADRVCQLLVRDPVKLRTGDGLTPTLDDAELSGDGDSGVDMITRDHDDADTG